MYLRLPGACRSEVGSWFAVGRILFLIPVLTAWPTYTSVEMLKVPGEETQPIKHQLAAILYADVAGYSRLTGRDEEATHEKLDASLSLLTNVITVHSGQTVHGAGDAILAEFQSVTAAVDAAADFQIQMAERDEPPLPAKTGPTG